VVPKLDLLVVEAKVHLGSLTDESTSLAGSRAN
jgi:hypothetical protein